MLVFDVNNPGIRALIQSHIEEGYTEEQARILAIAETNDKLAIYPKEEEKMKYVLFEKDSCGKQMVYCTKDDDEETLLENVANAMLIGTNFKKFNASENVCVNSGGIKNDTNIFSINENGVPYLYQLCGKVSDMTEFIVPHLYYVRKIGMIV